MTYIIIFSILKILTIREKDRYTLIEQSPFWIYSDRTVNIHQNNKQSNFGLYQLTVLNSYSVHMSIIGQNFEHC